MGESLLPANFSAAGGPWLIHLRVRSALTLGDIRSTIRGSF
jgi:hypothetical protein